MDVLVLLVGFLCAAAAGWAAVNAGTSVVFSVVAYCCTFVAVVAVGALLRRLRNKSGNDVA